MRFSFNYHTKAPCHKKKRRNFPIHYFLSLMPDRKIVIHSTSYYSMSMVYGYQLDAHSGFYFYFYFFFSTICHSIRSQLLSLCDRQHFLFLQSTVRRWQGIFFFYFPCPFQFWMVSFRRGDILADSLVCIHSYLRNSQCELHYGTVGDIKLLLLICISTNEQPKQKHF